MKRTSIFQARLIILFCFFGSLLVSSHVLAALKYPAYSNGIIGSYDTDLNARDVALSGNYAYVVSGSNQIQIFDISTPESPQLIKTLDTQGNEYTPKLFISGSTLYLASGGNGIRIIDISNPANPSELDPIQLDQFTNFGGWHTQGVFAGDNYIYVAGSWSEFDGTNWNWKQGLLIFADDTKAMVGQYVANNDARGIYVSDGYAYLAAGWQGGLKIINVKDPANPTIAGSVTTDGDARNVYVSGNYAYVADGWSGLAVVDISDQTSPAKVAQETMNNFEASDIFMDGNLVYLSDQNGGGLKCFDVTTPDNPKLRTMISGNASYGVAVAEYAYLAAGNSGLKIIDIGVAAEPRQVGYFSTSQTREVFVSGNYAYVADGWNGFKIYDISNPTKSIKKGDVTNLNAEVRGVAVSGDFAYLGCGDQGFKVVDISDPNVPSVVTTLSETGYQYWDVLVSGTYAYVKGRKDDWANDGLIIVNISSSTNLSQVGTLEIGSWFDGFDKAGEYLYLASGNNGLRIINVSDPASPVEASSIGLDHFARDVAVLENYAYVANDWGGLYVVNITDPVKPVLAGISKAQNTMSVAAIEGHVFTFTDKGVNIFDTTLPQAPILIGTMEYGSGWWEHQIIAANGYLYLSGQDRGLHIVSPYPVQALEDEALSYTIPTSAGSAYSGFSIDAGAQATGMSIDGSAVLSWSTPDNSDVGLHEIQVTADSDQLTYHLWVENLNQSPVITVQDTTLAWKHSSLNTFQVAVIDDDLNAPGYAESFVYQVDAGSLVKGINIDPQGVLKWTPGDDSVGDHLITVTITDKAGTSASQSFAVKVFDFSQQIVQVSGTIIDPQPMISNALDVKVAGDYAYVAGDNKLYILEAGDLETIVAIVDGPDDLWDVKAVDVLGDYAYVACNWHGLRIIDISTPGSPTVLLGANGAQGYKIQEQSWYNNVFIEEKNGKIYAYAVGSKEGSVSFFEAIDVSNPAAPVKLGNVDVSNEDWPSAVRVAGNYAYVAYGWKGLKIYNISNPSSIVLTGKIDGIGSIRDLVLGGNYAYLAAEWDGMRVIDISNPAIPALAATYSTNDSTKSFRGIDKQGDYVYLTSYAGDKMGLDIVDVSAPLSPKTVDAVKVDGSSNDIMGVNFSGDFVYATFGSGGVKAFSSLTIMAEKDDTLFSFETPVIGGSNFQLDETSKSYGMSINPDTGLVSWESLGPDQKEDGTSLYELTISYKDVSNNDQTINYFLWVQNVNTDPSITAVTETLAWKYGVQNSYQVEVVDADTAVKGYNESFTFSVDNASAGKGVFINDKGLLTWSPTADQAGEQTITVIVQDKAGATDSQDFAVKVFNIKQIPMVVGRITGLIENARVVKVQGNYAYVLDNNSMRILDITDINNPVKIGSAPCNDPRDLVLSGNYAYIADSWEGLRIVDISDKTAPQIKATFKSMSEGSWCHYESLAINGNYAYLAGEREQQRVMDVVDISDPTAPSLVQTESSYEVSNQNNDNFQSIKVSGNYAYLAQGWNGLTVLDVSNPGNITKVGGLQNIGWSRDLVLDPGGDYVYMAADWEGLKVVDITDPANPKVVGQFNPNDIWSQGIDVNGDYVYLASQTNQGGQLDIIDISDPYTPQLSGSIAGETDSFNQVDFEGGYLYVAGGSGGVTVISAGAVQAAEETKLLFEIPVIGGSSFDIDAASKAKGISIDSTTGVLSWDAPSNVDVGMHPVVVSYTKSNTSNSETYPIWVQNLNQSPQVAASESTLAWILNVKNHFTVQVSDEDQNAPGYKESFTFQVDATSSAKGISVDSNGNAVWNPDKSDVGEHELIVTVTDAAGAATQQTFNIQVFDLSLSPVQVGIIDEQLSNVRGLVVEGNYAYVLDNNRLNIYYANNVNSPELVGGIKFSPENDPNYTIGNPRDITLSGKYVYVALEWGGLQIIDITSKSAPLALISEVNDDYGHHYFKTGNNHYQTITISGDYAYTSGQTESGGNWYNFLEVIDVSNPESPVSKGKYLFTGSNIESIKVFGDYVIAAVGWEGLRTFDVSDPTEIQPAGTMQTSQHAYDLAVDSKGYAYLANEWGGLKIINISDPNDPSFAGGLGVSLNYNARSIDIFGNYAYLAGNKPEGAVLSIIDISDPLSPKLVDNLEIDTDHVFDQVDFTRAYAFVGSGADGVRIISPQTVLGQEGEILSFEMPVINAADYSFALDAVSGQKGMTVDATGTVNWNTPVNAHVGLHQVNAFVTDGAGSTSKLTYQVWVENVNQAPAFAAGMVNTLDWYWNVTNTFKLPIDDDDLYAPGYQESFTYGIDVSQVTGDTKPEIDVSTGVIVWTPGWTQKSDTGYPVTITVTDAAGEATQTNINLKIKDPDVPFGSDYHTPENAQVFQITGKPMVSSLIEESDLIQPDWFKFTLDEKAKVLLSLSTHGQSDYLVELVSGQTDMTLSDLLADNKGIITGNVAVNDVDVMSWTGIIEQARGIFFKDSYMFSALDNELNVYSLNQEPVEIGSTFLGVGPFTDIKSYQGHTYARTENCMTWEQAQALAEKAGGYLAVVDDQAENQFFTDNYVWNAIGYNDIAAEGTWVLADGKPAGFINWSEGQPDDHENNQDVAQITGDGTWDDVSDGCMHYIIEWDALTVNLSFAFKTEGNEKVWFSSPPQMSENLIVVSGNNWDDDLQKSVTYKGAVDITDPGSPKWMGQIQEGEVRSQWTTRGEYIYSASEWQDGSDKVYVYHVSDNGLTQVNMLEDFNANTQFQQVMAGDNLLLIKAYNGQKPHITDKWGNPIHHCLFIYDLADPTSPVLINVIDAGENGAGWNIVTVSQGYAVFDKLDGTLASFDLETLQTCSGFGYGEGKIESIGSVTAVSNNQSKNNLTSPIMYLPNSMGNTFDAVHMAANGQLKRLINIEDKGYLKAAMPGGQTFLVASTAALNSKTIYSLYNLEVQKGAWVYESFEVKSGTGAQVNWWEPQQEKEDSFGYDSVAVGLEPGTYYVKVSDTGDFDSTQKYALSCSVEGGFTINVQTQYFPIAETPSVYEDFIFSLLDTNNYFFTVVEDLQFFLEFENSSFFSDYTLTLVNDSLWSQEKFSLSPGQDLISSFNLVAGDYSLLLENTLVVDALSDYTLSLSTLETDGSKETESNNDYTTADVYVLGEEFAGHIAHNKDYDYFVFNLGQSKALDVEISVMKASKGSFRLDLILSGVVIDTMTVEAGTFEKFNLGLFPGRYFIRISGSGVDSTDEYSFTLTEIDGVDQEFEPNNEKQFANSLSEQTVKQGRLYGNGDADWYAFNCIETGLFIFDFNGLGDAEENYNVQILNIAGTSIMKFQVDGNQSNSDMKGLYPGNYYIRISGSAIKTGKYTFEGIGQIVELKELLTLMVSSENDVYDIDKNGQLQLTAAANYSDGSVADISSNAEWKSLNTEVADVSVNGLVSGIQGGSATIAVSYGDKETKKKTASFTVNVIDPDLVTKKFTQTYGNLIIVAGGGVQASNKLADTTQSLCDYVYMKFKGRGFEDEDIYYFNPVAYKDLNGNGFDDQIVDQTSVNVGNFFGSIDGWAKGYPTNGPLYIYLNDHGAEDMFQLYPGQILTASQFASSLDQFQAATGRKVVVIIEACHSGSFVDNLQAQDRLVVTSSGDGLSYLGNNGAASFSMFFMDALYKGSNILTAYDDSLIKLADLGKPYSMMYPKYEDQGGLLSDLYVVGDFALAPLFAEIIEVNLPTEYAIGSGGMNIQAQVTGAEGGSVWATIKPLDYEPPPVVGDFATPQIQFPSITLVDEKQEQFDQVYEGTSDELVVNGDYEIVIFAKDSEGNVTKSSIYEVSVTGSSNSQWPQAAFDYSPTQIQVGDEITFTDTSTDDGTIVSWLWDFGDETSSSNQDPTHTYNQAGAYAVTLTVTDDHGADNIYSALVSVGGTYGQIEMGVAAGWNLLSSRLDFSVNEKFSYGAKFASVWKWEDSAWAVYLPGESDGGAAYAAGKGFAVLSIINPGEGFWVNAIEPETITISGIAASGSLSLSAGWNLAGLKGDQGKTVTTLISGNEANIASVWKWEDGGWAVYLPGESDGGVAYAVSKGFTVLTNIEPGEGFWVNATQQITLD